MTLALVTFATLVVHYHYRLSRCKRRRDSLRKRLGEARRDYWLTVYTLEGLPKQMQRQTSDHWTYGTEAGRN